MVLRWSVADGQRMRVQMQVQVDAWYSQSTSTEHRSQPQRWEAPTLLDASTRGNNAVTCQVRPSIAPQPAIRCLQRLCCLSRLLRRTRLLNRAQLPTTKYLPHSQPSERSSPLFDYYFFIFGFPNPEPFFSQISIFILPATSHKKIGSRCKSRIGLISCSNQCSSFKPLPVHCSLVKPSSTQVWSSVVA